MKIILVAGGTGGHIYPALELANYLKKDNEIIFFGNNKRMESKLIPKSGYPFFGYDAEMFSGSLLNRINSIFSIYDSYVLCKAQLKLIKPDMVIGFGNYVSVPAVLAAKRLKIKTMIHEQNSLIGSANKLLSYFVDGVVVSFESSLKGLPKSKSYFYGNPRADIVKHNKINANVLAEYDLKVDMKTILFFMGSLGSTSINEFMLGIIKELRNKEYQVLYITGEKYFAEFANNFNQSSNVKIIAYGDTAKLMPNVTLLVCRAGATTVAEIAALGVPAIFIPSPYVPFNHQYYNALTLVQSDAAMLIEEKDLNNGKFVELLDKTMEDYEFLCKLKKNVKKFSSINPCAKIELLIRKIVGEI